MKTLKLFLSLILIASIGHTSAAKPFVGKKPSQRLMDSLLAATYQDSARRQAVIQFMNEMARANPVVDRDGWIQVGRVLQNPYKIEGAIACDVKPVKEGVEISFKGDLNGFDRLDMKVNSGLAKAPEGPTPTEILFKGYDAVFLNQAQAVFTVTPDKVVLKTVEKIK